MKCINEQNAKKLLYLTVGKEVTLSFSRDHSRLECIRLSTNKLAELISNGLISRESIFDISRISLITKSNYKTEVLIDQIRTRRQAEGKDIFTNGNFIFFIEKSQFITHSQLYTLYKNNKKK